MRNTRRTTVLILLLISLLFTFVLCKTLSTNGLPSFDQSAHNGNGLLASTTSRLTKPDAATLVRIKESYHKLPLSFESNKGQIDKQVDFISRGNGYNLFLKATEAVLTLNSGNSCADKDRTNNSERRAPIDKLKDLISKSKSKSKSTDVDVNVKSTVLKMQIVGADANAQVSGVDQLAVQSNYFIGNDQKHWRTNVASYSKVKYQNIYAGIDMVYYGNQRELEYDFIVRPGSDLNKIKLHFDGAKSLQLADNGDLIIKIDNGYLRKQKPLIYQEIDGHRELVTGNYIINKDKEIGFHAADYDITRPLIIDPVLSYSTYLGGNNDDFSRAIALDAQGNTYIVGNTNSINFPGNNDPSANANDPIDPRRNPHLFITKMNAEGNALVYATYIDGGNEESGYSVAVDAQGNAYVVGVTTSEKFPVVNAIQPKLGGESDGFILKVNAEGSSLLYSTYLGGKSFDAALALALDNQGNAYVGSIGISSDFPISHIIDNRPSNNIFSNAFVTKFDSDGKKMDYSTRLSCDGNIYLQAIAVDAQGSAYLTGFTDGFKFPTANALQPNNATQETFVAYDTFISKLNTQGDGLIYSTYLGGDRDDYGEGIAVDASGDVYITGYTFSRNFPTVNALQSALHPKVGDAVGYDAFITKLNSAGSALIYSTYLGGSGDELASALAVDAGGNAYSTGFTSSKDFPITKGAIESTNDEGTSAYVIKLNSEGSALTYSTYLGGSSGDTGRGIAVDAQNNIYVVGSTTSADFPTSKPLQLGSGNTDAFITKIDLERQPILPVFNSFSPKSGLIGSTVIIEGSDLADVATVKFNGIAATFSIASATSIKATVPANATSGIISLISGAGSVSSTKNFTIMPNIDALDPRSGAIGANISINGSGFTGTKKVKFNTTKAKKFEVVSDTQIMAIVPKGAISGTIKIITAGGTAISAESFTVVSR